MMTREKMIARMSGHLLCNVLPEDYTEWEYEKLVNFIDENKWEVLEWRTAEEVFEHIADLADDVLSILSER